MTGSTGLTLTLSLDDLSMEVLENLAATQRCSVDEYIMGLVRKAVKAEQKQRRHKDISAHEAPMDAFLPDGVDPFEPVAQGETGLASSFDEVQTRMRFAGTPSIFRETI